MKRAVVYARVSSNDRGNESRNLQGQLDMCRQYVQKKGWHLVAELPEDDRGASGASFDLPQLNQALQMARNKEFDVLVVRELDRFARALAKQLIVEGEFKRAGVEIEYVLGEYPDTPEGTLMKNVRATIAEYEREKIRERIVRGRRLKVKAGNVIIPNGQAPFGYRLVTKDKKRTLEINEEEAKIVRMIFSWYVLGDEKGKRLSLYRIMRKLTELRIPTPADVRNNNHHKIRKWGEWGISSVKNILSNETYCGTWHYGKRPRPQDGESRVAQDKDNCLTVEVPAIVSREVWEEAQKRFKQNLKNSRRNTKFKYLFRKRVTCGECGMKMGCRATPNTRKNYSLLYYICPRKQRTIAAIKCSARQFRADYVDDSVWEWLRSFLTNPQKLTKGLEAFKAEQEKHKEPLLNRLDVLQSLLQDHEKQYERLLDLYLSGELPKEMLVDRKARLEATIQTLENEQQNLLAHITTYSVSEDELQSIQLHAAQIAELLNEPETDSDFETKKQIVELLDVQVTLIEEDDPSGDEDETLRAAYVTCKIGKAKIRCDLPTTQLRYVFHLRP